MSDGGILLDKIRKKEAEIQSLEDKLKTARIYLQALHDVRDALGAMESGQSDSALRTGSAVAQAREAIQRAGKPLHISDLLSALGKSVTKEARASLTSSLAAYVRRGEIFTRPAPNTFGLAEMGHASAQPESELETEPPPDFGGSSVDDGSEIPF